MKTRPLLAEISVLGKRELRHAQLESYPMPTEFTGNAHYDQRHDDQVSRIKVVSGESGAVFSLSKLVDAFARPLQLFGDFADSHFERNLFSFFTLAPTGFAAQELVGSMRHIIHGKKIEIVPPLTGYFRKRSASRCFALVREFDGRKA